MKKSVFIFSTCVLVAAGFPAITIAASKLVGGRGATMSPVLVEPAFSYDDAKRSPFLPPGIVEAPTADGKNAVSGGELSGEEVQAGITVQAVFLVRGEPQALVNNQSAKNGQNIKVLIRGKMVSLLVLDVNRNENSVRLNYKGTEFVRAMGGNKISKP